ncbi:low molecular weight protein-tyrosine-phosphatase [Dyadobacter tibetensis]|uniref:low molecular weight protein-tyrosine-phosphatase n=1 Tax=Dyadobacter tibetensis TaxID=1211851 RepID=UPI00047197A6|nr:low molecular weight protein-tyrosine-phosphatase [Dyadobacter tibetensis]
MIRILFVCLGNICRSPITEGVFNALVQEKGLKGQFHCDSAGTGAYHIGCLPDSRMRAVAKRHGLALIHRARQLQQSDFQDFDYILAMDEANYRHIARQCFQQTGSIISENKLFLYRQFDPQRGESQNVPDPYYEDDDAFEEVYQIAYRCAGGFMEFLKERHF